MVASPAMRAIRELPLAASLLARRALRSSSAAAPARLAAVARRRRAARAARPRSRLRGVPGGWPALVPLAPSPSGSRSRSPGRRCPTAPGTTRTARSSTSLFAALGLWLARPHARARARAGGAARRGRSSGRSSARCCRRSTTTARRSRAPARAGRLWNQLALLGDFALPLALWRRAARRGTLLAYGWLVALAPHLLARRARSPRSSSSRWLVLVGRRLEALATLVAAAAPGRGRRRRSRSRCPA